MTAPDPLLDELRAEWPDGRWTRDRDEDEDEDTVAGMLDGHHLHVYPLEPYDLLATDTLRWEAVSGDAEGLGRSPVEAVRALLRRVS